MSGEERAIRVKDIPNPPSIQQRNGQRAAHLFALVLPQFPQARLSCDVDPMGQKATIAAMSSDGVESTARRRPIDTHTAAPGRPRLATRQPAPLKFSPFSSSFSPWVGPSENQHAHVRD
jgi:hypothetical protein